LAVVALFLSSFDAAAAAVAPLARVLAIAGSVMGVSVGNGVSRGALVPWSWKAVGSY
jgi:hypothetical protein